MTRRSREHNLITLNIATQLRNHLRGKSYQVFVGDMKVTIKADDVSVTCNSQNKEFFKLNLV